MSKLSIHFGKIEGWAHGFVEVYAFHGVEEISAPYQFEIGIRVPDAFSATRVVGHPATFHYEGGGGTEGENMVVHGKIAAIQATGHERGHTTYQLILVPSLWNLSLAHHSRAWTNCTILDVFRNIFVHLWGYDEATQKSKAGNLEFRLDESLYKKRELICQYNETDLAFVSRWMEREGMYYFFEQSNPDAGGVERLIITDHNIEDPAFRSPKKTLHYGNGGHRALEIDTFHPKLTAVSYDVDVKDYDFRNPGHPVQSSPHRIAQRDQRSSKRDKVVIYGEHLEHVPEANRISEVRAQAISARRHVIEGGADIHGFRAGYRFHCDVQVGADAEHSDFLVTHVEHWGSTKVAGDQALRAFESTRRTRLGHLSTSFQFSKDEKAYHARFRCVPSGKADPTYRHPQDTPIPRIHSMVRGVFTGNAITDSGVQLYEVLLDFDELESFKVMARLVQPHGAMQFKIPDGSEVLVEFLAGNVDRPVISNVVPNAARPGPKSGPNLNVIESEGKNRIELDDNPGSESLTASSPIDDSYLRLGNIPGGFSAHLNTLGSSQFTFGQAWSVAVGAPTLHAYTDRYEVSLSGYSYKLEDAGIPHGRIQEEAGEVQTKVHGLASHDFDEHALAARKQGVQVQEDQDTSVGQNYRLAVGQGYETRVNQQGDHTVTARSFSLGVEGGGASTSMTVDPHNGFVYDLDHVMTVNQDQRIDVKRDHFLSVVGSHWITAAQHNVRIDQNHETQVGQGWVLTAGTVCDVVVGQSRMTVRPDGFYHPDQHKVTVQGYHRMTVEADHDLRVAGSYNVLTRSYTLSGADSVTITSPMTIIS